MKKWLGPVAASMLLSGCVSTATKTIDAQALAGVRNQSVVQTAREMPDFSEMTPAKATFGLIGAAMMISEGNKTIATYKIPDPAIAIGDALLRAMQSSQGMQIVPSPIRIDGDDPARIAELAKGKARYVLDVRSVMWSMAYFPTDWTHYRVMYTVKARLIDADTKNVVAEAFCKQIPESNANAPTFDDMLALNGARLKAINAAYSQACAETLGREMLALQVPALAPSSTLAATAAPAPAAMPAPQTAPAPASVAGPGNWSGVMACGARKDSGARAQAYEARFAVEVQGNAVSVHRRTPEVEESLSGQAANGQLELQGTGHRVGEPARPWRLAVSGAFPEGATRYHGMGAMTANGQQLRKCELDLTRM